MTRIENKNKKRKLARGGDDHLHYAVLPAAGFEPAPLAGSDLESDTLDHSVTQARQQVKTTIYYSIHTILPILYKMDCF